MKSKFKLWQWVIAVHYKNRPRVQITSIDESKKEIQIWVEEDTKKGLMTWWGPESWFKAIPKRKRKIAECKARYERAVLCDGKIPGCTCNQSTSVSQ